MKKVIGQQGECLIIQIDAIPANVETKPHKDKTARGIVIAHSESGHHHVLTGGDVMERVSNVPAGMQIFYALLDEPAEFVQDAADPHGGFDLPAGVFEFRISREYNPFTEMARKVAD